MRPFDEQQNCGTEKRSSAGSWFSRGKVEREQYPLVVSLDYYLLDESPTSANLGNDHEFIIKEYYLDCMRLFGKPKPNPLELMLGQYHIIVENRVQLTWYQSHALNLTRILKCRRTPKELTISIE